MNEIRTDNISKEPLRLLRALVQTGKLVELHLDGVLDEADLSLTRLFTLNRLEQAAEPLSLSNLAACLAFVKSNATQVIDRLEKEQLVKRVPDSTDRRCTRLALTDEGQQRHEIGLETIQPFIDRLNTIYTAEEQGLLVRLLQRLNTSLV